MGNVIKLKRDKGPTWEEYTRTITNRPAPRAAVTVVWDEEEQTFTLYTYQTYSSDIYCLLEMGRAIQMKQDVLTLMVGENE